MISLANQGLCDSSQNGIKGPHLQTASAQHMADGETCPRASGIATIVSIVGVATRCRQRRKSHHDDSVGLSKTKGVAASLQHC